MNRRLSTEIALAAGTFAALLVAAGIYFGSGGLRRFDTPLAAYAAATVFAAFAVVYRYAMWLQRPPTWSYFKSTFRIFFKPSRLLPNIGKLLTLLWSYIFAQTFIEKRSTRRWLAHMGLFWGCMLAFAITFPLSWGWIQFGVAGNGSDYAVEFMGRPMLNFPPTGIVAFLFFNGLNISAVLVLFGVGLAMHRRVFERGAQAVQTIANDLIPLFILFAVSVTGLMLTASYKLMGGSHFSFLSLLHAFTVIIFLLWIPFGKFFHIIQRPAQVGVAYYKEEGRQGAQAICARSGEAYQSQMHHEDLSDVMRELDLDFGEHQNLSPLEKRKLIALNQAEAIDGAPYVG
jgi:hypothetical protein